MSTLVNFTFNLIQYRSTLWENFEVWSEIHFWFQDCYWICILSVSLDKRILSGSITDVGDTLIIIVGECRKVLRTSLPFITGGINTPWGIRLGILESLESRVMRCGRRRGLCVRDKECVYSGSGWRSGDGNVNGDRPYGKEDLGVSNEGVKKVQMSQPRGTGSIVSVRWVLSFEYGPKISLLNYLFHNIPIFLNNWFTDVFRGTFVLS